MKNRLNILYISQYFPPEMGAPAARVFELSREWVKAGHAVTVLTAMPNHPTGVVPPEYRGKWQQTETHEGITVQRCWIYAAPNKGFLKRILNYFSFMVSALVIGTPRTGKADVVIGTSPQFLAAVAAFLISRLKRKPFIFEVRDLWPESIVQLGQIRHRGIIRLLETVEMYLYRKSAHVVVVTESTADVLITRGIPGEKISVMKNGVDLQLFSPRGALPALRQRLGLEAKFVVTYIGTHGLSHALHVVLRTAQLLKSNPDIHFLFIGEGAEKEHLISLAQQWQLPNVTFLPQQPKQHLPDYYALSDVILVPLRRLPVFKTVIPSKIFEIMAMGKPILISVDGEAREIVQKAGAGIFIPPEDPEALKEGILHLQHNESLRHALGKAGREFVVTHFDRSKIARDYLHLITRVVKNNGGSA